MVYGIYIHIPFCRQSCKYCHFVTVPPERNTIERYLAAVIREIEIYGDSRDKKIEVDTIYFGGGTPSLLPPENLGGILEVCRDCFKISGDCEISIEANPDTLQSDNLKSYLDYGINRISIGAQSFNDRELKAIGRMHTSAAINTSVNTLREKGFHNISLDLLMGLPFQTPESWRETLEKLAALDVEHISVYMLDLDQPCPLAEAVADGSITVPCDDTIADSYLETLNILTSYGYEQYEISNFARQGYSCRHNLKYWLRERVIGFGLASHSYDGRSRYANFSKMDMYLQSLELGRLPVEWRKTLERNRALEETLFLGLRLNKGIQWARLQQDYPGKRLAGYEKSLRKLSLEGLVQWKDGTVRLTPSGMLLSNEIFQLFV